MIIRKMTASYGKLSGAQLELSPGLNIISVPNESGKSTWSSFIRNMLYGVDSSAREKGGVKPEKLRFAPWSGAPMSGTMDIACGGKEISLSRSGTENAPMRELTAVYAGTNERVPALAANAGEELLGISRGVFERTAFIGQGSIAVSAGPELEERIAAIVETGDEGSSFTKAEERLRSAMRARRHNKTGQLPELEGEISALRETLEGIESENAQVKQLKESRDLAIKRRDELTDAVARSREVQRKKSLDSLSESRERLSSLESEYEAAKNEIESAGEWLRSSRFADISPNELSERASEDMGRVSELYKSIARLKPVSFGVLLILLPALFCVVSALLWPYKHIPVAICGLLILAAVIRLIISQRKRKAIRGQIAGILSEYGASSPEEVWDAVDTHKASHASYLELIKSFEDVSDRLREEKRLQSSRDLSIVSELDFTSPGSQSAGLSRELEEAEARLKQIREELARAQGRISAMGDEEHIREKISELESRHQRLSLEYKALSLAAETIAQAGAEIQTRLTPRLSKRSGELFSQLTGGRYSALALDRKLNASARPDGDTISRESSYLSAGALNQLYLAVRLALCEIALPKDKPCPIILDDALCSFDDERCAAALMLLYELSKERQVILFTCHEREARIMEGFEGVNIIASRAF